MYLLALLAAPVGDCFGSNLGVAAARMIKYSASHPFGKGAGLLVLDATVGVVGSSYESTHKFVRSSIELNSVSEKRESGLITSKQALIYRQGVKKTHSTLDAVYRHQSPSPTIPVLLSRMQASAVPVSANHLVANLGQLRRL